MRPIIDNSLFCIKMFEKKRILVIGQIPPPYGGQAISIKLMLDGDYHSLKFYHIRMSFSKEMDEIGKFNFGKIFHLIKIICLTYIYRFRYKIPVLYYVPAGPNKLSMYRDFLILPFVRFLFEKIVFQFRAAGISEMYSKITKIERFFYEKAYFYPDLAIALSEFGPNDCNFVKAKRQLIIPNGLKDHYLEYEYKKNISNVEPVRILFVGLLIESKGILDLVKACALLCERGLRFDVHIIGQFHSADIQKKIKLLIEKYNMERYFKLCGVLHGIDKWTEFGQSDIFAFPSYFNCEAMPRVVLEAMCFKIPVVSTYWRGIQSMVEDGITGFLVPIKNPEMLAAKLELLIQDPILRFRMGQCGRQKYLRQFSLEKFYTNIESAFRCLYE